MQLLTFNSLPQCLASITLHASCKWLYYRLYSCTHVSLYIVACECDSTGTVGGSKTCDNQGQCQCLANFGGKKCDSCAPGYHNHPTCKSCDCNLLGSFGRSCDQESAQCSCRQNFIGLKCSSYVSISLFYFC